MLLKNLDLEAGAGRMLVNGSRGVVIGFRDRAEVQQLGGMAGRRQHLPLWLSIRIWPSAVLLGLDSKSQKPPSASSGLISKPFH